MLALLRSASRRSALLRLVFLRSVLRRSAPLRSVPRRSARRRSSWLKSASLRSECISACCFRHAFQTSLPCRNKSSCCRTTKLLTCSWCSHYREAETSLQELPLAHEPLIRAMCPNCQQNIWAFSPYQPTVLSEYPLY